MAITGWSVAKSFLEPWFSLNWNLHPLNQIKTVIVSDAFEASLIVELFQITLRRTLILDPLEARFL